MHKVDALANKLQYVQPTVACTRYRRNLGGQESSTNIETLIEVLSNCDLLIDATADSRAFNYVSSVSRFAHRAMIWGEVFAGGFGGFIARSRPNIEPDPASMRQSILHWSNEQGHLVARASGRYEGDPENPAIADDAEAQHYRFSYGIIGDRYLVAPESDILYIRRVHDWLTSGLDIRPSI